MAIQPTPTPSPTVSSKVDPGLVTPGPVGFIVILVVTVVTVLLILDMVRRIRRLRYGGGLDAAAAEARAEVVRGDEPPGASDSRREEPPAR